MTSLQVRRALSFLVQCGDAGPLLNIMGVYRKQETQVFQEQDSETDKEDCQVNGKADKEVGHVHGEEDEEEGQVEDASPLADEVLPNYQTASYDQTEKQKSSILGFAESRHSDILDKQIENAINAVMGEKNVKKPTAFTDGKAAETIQDVKLEQEESHLVEFFEEEPENTLEKKYVEEQPKKNPEEKKFVKVNRRVYSLEKSLLRANRRVYNLPMEVVFFLQFFFFFFNFQFR